MEIIRKGKVPAGTKIDCKNCQSELRYLHKDVKCDDRPCAVPYVVCPVCNAHIPTL